VSVFFGVYLQKCLEVDRTRRGEKPRSSSNSVFIGELTASMPVTDDRLLWKRNDSVSVSETARCMGSANYAVQPAVKTNFNNVFYCQIRWKTPVVFVYEVPEHSTSRFKIILRVVGITRADKGCDDLGVRVKIKCELKVSSGPSPIHLREVK